MADDQQDDDVEIQDFILSRELAEVYLLMDHISECQYKEIPKSIDKDPVFASRERSWIEQICEIAWPPESSTRRQDARNAARLIRAKDVLNKAAAPATGGSIAFTLMVAGEARDPGSGAWWRRALMWMADGKPRDPAEPGGEAEPGDGTGSEGDGGGSRLAWAGKRAPSRASLAALAYPALSRRAWQYRLALYFLLVFLVLWLLVTCVLSWDVATGNSLLKRVTALETRVTTLQSAAVAPPSNDPSTGGAAALPQSGAGAPQTGAPGRAVAGQAQSSADLDRAIELRTVATENLRKWMEEKDFIRQILIDRMGGERAMPTVILPVPAGGLAAQAPPIPNVEWAAVLLGILASNILPIFYGLLGAGAAVVRGVSTKMRDSLLAPRDILLAYVQLALGAVIGACIGLFVSSEGSAATEQGGLLGSVPLSASALCFVAGFGVEGVFQALESLIRRVFNLEAARPAPTV